MNPRTLIRTVPALALATCVAMGAQARSSVEIDDDRDVPKRVVYFGDLDLSKPAGAQTLYKRIRLAAKMVCRNEDVWDLRRIQRHRECFDTAVADAIAKVNRPTLTAIYREKLKRTPG